jgi:dolichyl-phosphate-mannose-protein mannosyltransferase
MSASRWTRVDWLACASVTIGGGLLRLRGLRNPGSMIFDEFYANDACFYLHSSSSICGVPREITPVHPPLGKWLIALGIRTFGFDPTGWRIASVVAGTLTIAAVYVLGRKLLGSTLGAAVASGLLAVDFLHVVMSRVAMLDVFVTFLSVIAFLCLAYDRDRLLSAARPPPQRGFSLRDRPWRFAAGAAAGAAAASKWSGWLALAGVIALTIGWEISARVRRDDQGVARRVAVEEGPTVLLGLVLVPLVVYAATFAGRLHGSLLALPWADNSWIRAFVDRQVSMARFHLPLSGDNPYASPAWSWLLLKRPVVLALYQPTAGRVKEVMATGNPIVWWASIPALALLVVRWIRRGITAAPAGFIVTAFAVSYIPWLVLGLARQQLFLFYLLPAVPFLCLALGAVAASVGSSIQGRVAVATFGVATVTAFAFFYPILTAAPLSSSGWKARIVFRDCGQPITPPPTPRAIPNAARSPSAAAASSAGRGVSPPQGWCWL